ncbi:MAG TPA: class I SAM-dependent methyltransferase [Anseongella sp.]
MERLKSTWKILLLIACIISTVNAQETPDLDVPYVPTSQEVVNAMLDLAGVTARDVVYDLGCGDGRIVITAAKKYGATGTGIDIDPERITEATENAKKAGVGKKVKFIKADLFESDFSEASVVTLYLLSTINMKLRPILLKQLKPGTRIVSHAFDMGDWEPDETRTVNGTRIYLWTVPEK